MGKIKDEATPDESEMFEAIIQAALELRSDTFPENPAEFDLHVDNDYNFYMFIKGQWTKTGINVSVIN